MNNEQRKINLKSRNNYHCQIIEDFISITTKSMENKSFKIPPFSFNTLIFKKNESKEFDEDKIYSENKEILRTEQYDNNSRLLSEKFLIPPFRKKNFSTSTGIINLNMNLNFKVNLNVQNNNIFSNLATENCTMYSTFNKTKTRNKTTDKINSIYKTSIMTNLLHIGKIKSTHNERLITDNTNKTTTQKLFLKNQTNNFKPNNFNSKIPVVKKNLLTNYFEMAKLINEKQFKQNCKKEISTNNKTNIIHPPISITNLTRNIKNENKKFVSTNNMKKLLECKIKVK
jgi:hypothetical protein